MNTNPFSILIPIQESALKNDLNLAFIVISYYRNIIMKQIITKEDVSKAMLNLTSAGKKTTINAIYAALNGRGSMSTIVRLKAEIDAATKSETDSSAGIKAFREVWALAVVEGQKQQEVVLVELRDSLKALAAENERMEGAAMALQNQINELEKAKSRAESELSQVRVRTDGELKLARTALAESTTQAASALQTLAEAQTSHAKQIAALQADLNDATRKSHDLELQLVRSSALLEAKESVRPVNVVSRKTKPTK